MFHQPDNKTGHADLGAHVEKLCNHSADEAAILQNSPETLPLRTRSVGVAWGHSHFWELRKCDEKSHRKEDQGDSKIREFDSLGFSHSKAQQLRSCHHRSRHQMRRSSQNKARSENWGHDGADCIKGLSNVEATLSRFWGPKDGHIRIRCNFQERLAASH